MTRGEGIDSVIAYSTVHQTLARNMFVEVEKEGNHCYSGKRKICTAVLPHPMSLTVLVKLVQSLAKGSHQLLMASKKQRRS